MIKLWIGIASLCLVSSLCAPAFASGSASSSYAVTISSTGSTAGVSVSSTSLSGSAPASTSNDPSVAFPGVTVTNTGSASEYLYAEVGAPSGITDNTMLSAANQFDFGCNIEYGGNDYSAQYITGSAFASLGGSTIPSGGAGTVYCNADFSAGTPVGTYSFPMTFMFG